MYIYYNKCKCKYGTYRVGGEDKPVFYLWESPPEVNVFELGFQEVHYGLWCRFLSDEENEKMKAYFKRPENS